MYWHGDVSKSGSGLDFKCTSRHELDITGRVEGVEETVLTGSENSLKGQASCMASRIESVSVKK